MGIIILLLISCFTWLWPVKVVCKIFTSCNLTVFKKQNGLFKLNLFRFENKLFYFFVSMWHVTLFHRCVKIISLLFFEVLYFSDFLLCILPVCCFVCICLWLYLTDKAFCHDIVNVCASGFPTPRSHHPDPVTPQEETLEPFSVPRKKRKQEVI